MSVSWSISNDIQDLLGGHCRSHTDGLHGVDIKRGPSWDLGARCDLQDLADTLDGGIFILSGCVGEQLEDQGIFSSRDARPAV